MTSERPNDPRAIDMPKPEIAATVPTVHPKTGRPLTNVQRATLVAYAAGARTPAELAEACDITVNQAATRIYAAQAAGVIPPKAEPMRRRPGEIDPDVLLVVGSIAVGARGARQVAKVCGISMQGAQRRLEQAYRLGLIPGNAFRRPRSTTRQQEAPTPR